VSRSILLVVHKTGEAPVKDALATDLAFGRGVVALLDQNGRELWRGDEIGARFADGLEVAVQFNWPGADGDDVNSVTQETGAERARGTSESALDGAG
jgi:hypothetical protein